MIAKSDNVIRIGIVGAGKMAREHAKAFAAVNNAKVVGISSRTESKARILADELGIEGVFKSVSDLYEGAKADIVVIAVSVLAVAPIVEECLSFPWLILAEKPVGVSVEESERTAVLVEARKARVFVALNRRQYSSTREAHKLLSEQSGPRFIHVMDQQDMGAVRQLGFPERVVERFMYANSIHLVDYFSCFGRGDVEHVEIVEPWRQSKPEVVIAKIKFDSGDMGLYQAVWNGPGPWAVSVNQGNVRVDMRPLEELSYRVKGDRQLYSVPASDEDNSYKPGLFQQARRCVDAVRMGGAQNLASMREAMRTVKLIGSIYPLTPGEVE